ncbi:unnamed protein product [Arabis nemorensis]|uniref:Phytocyanin domain-containing protein n=1 Tax=Arabis nemorensis TaxID=586526 RepID=A0A565BGI6_9BRAS|nr:unnamed protein product [Arabis nemorensis]
MLHGVRFSRLYSRDRSHGLSQIVCGRRIKGLDRAIRSSTIESMGRAKQIPNQRLSAYNKDAATAKFTDGHTSFTLNRSRPYYFISGSKDNCHKNPKLVIIVMADRSNSNTTIPASSPSSPSPPYTGTFEITPGPSEGTPGNTTLRSSSSVLPFAFVGTLFLSLTI